MSAATWESMKRPPALFQEDLGYPQLDIRAGKTDLGLISDQGIGYHVSLTNTGAVVIRSERSRRAAMFAIEDLVALAIEQGIDEVKP